MKKIMFFIGFWAFFTPLFAQIPAGYYDNADGLGSDALKNALHNIIKGHNELTYTQLLYKHVHII